MIKCHMCLGDGWILRETLFSGLEGPYQCYCEAGEGFLKHDYLTKPIEAWRIEWHNKHSKKAKR